MRFKRCLLCDRLCSSWLNPSTEYEYTIEATSTVDGDNDSTRLLSDDGTSIEDFRYGTLARNEFFTFAKKF